MEKFLKPLPGLIVRDPRTKVALPEQGMFKTFIGPEGRYWRRRLKDGSVIVTNPPKKSESNTKPSRRKSEE